MIERDFNIPPLAELVGEVRHLSDLHAKWRNTRKLAQA